MATITSSHRCSKCREIIGIVNCEGCKEIFCTKHITEHRKELSTKLNHHLLKHNDILKQLLDKEEKKDSSKKDILLRINQWENYMIERIRYKAELARERLVQLIDNDEKTIIKNAKELTKEINKKHKTENLLEEDIEQLKQSIIHVKQAVDRLTRQSDVELYIEPSYMIDWNHLIYVREKSVKVISSLGNKQTTDEHSTDSNQQRASASDYNSESSSSSISSDEESDSQEINSSCDPYLLMDSLSNEQINSSAKTKPSSSQLEKQPSPLLTSVTLSNHLPLLNVKQQTRRPLVIIDPVSHNVVEREVRDSSPDISRTTLEVKSKSETTSLSATDKAQKHEELTRRLVDILRGSPET